MYTSTPELTVNDVFLPLNKIPVASTRTLMKEALESMTAHRLGIVSVVDDNGRLTGIFTDGDLRRMLLRDQKPLAALFADDVADHAASDPVTVAPETSLSDAVTMMEEKGIWDLPVVGDGGELKGLLHLHPAIKAVLGL